MTKDDHDAVPAVLATEMSSLLSTTHGQERRVQRKIDKVQLQRARRYGMKEPSREGRIKYTYGGVVFVYDPDKCCEVTSFRSRDIASKVSGTKCVKPIMLAKNSVYETEAMRKAHAMVQKEMLETKSKWTSHSVLVVDMSGSMRRDDVNGARCRSDGVWMILARDFVKHQLESGSCSSTDVVSVVLMKKDAEVALECEPMDWVLYNDLVDKREWSELRPCGDGNYMPALEMADLLLDANKLGSCSLSLMFFSDGKPSDHGDFASRMGTIASKFGRRLSISCIGMADKEEDFSTLEAMVREAKQFGAVASFDKPSLDTDSLANIVSTLITTMTTTKTEITDITTGKVQSVRTDIRRERSNTPDDLKLNENWDTYHNSSNSNYVARVWSWSTKKDDFVYIMDPRCGECYQVVGDIDTTANKGQLCSRCKACFYCNSPACQQALHNHQSSHECVEFLEDRRAKQLIPRRLPSFSFAVKKSACGEGAERLVRNCRWLDAQQGFIGPRMVAKESRFVEKKGSYTSKMDYHRQFMRTQVLAQRFAEKFNENLDEVYSHFDEVHHDTLKCLPRIQFLEPLVLELHEGDKDLILLVEPKLEGAYCKFSSNNGWQYETEDTSAWDGASFRSFVEGSSDFSLVERNAFQGGGLGAIEEGSEDEEEEDDDGIMDDSIMAPNFGTTFKLSEDLFPPAFSHFTYEKSKQQFMVVDLQGVLHVRPDGTRCFMLTDPAIHRKRKSPNPLSHSNINLGRTDRGEKGIKAFFETHECNDVCRMLGLPHAPNHED
ncbi:Myosin heavy chain kinase [Seminavis robusta]|uniref:Myosin heavy chain kinase n=1 Tax=Seminavis robusta TaxID=568900 RepID=A0A9N8DSD4_9STRA|nr:Myosin heavy chain kinase [Seminavis robusta]|eukprot:Sro253_g099920.1 Myosin heavy chain kinase (777) ;mRNA; r:48563-50986